jgi:hypothetical protein
MTSTRPQVAFRDAFRVAEFRYMWFAELWSIAGDQLARVALSFMVLLCDSTLLVTAHMHPPP